MTRLMILATVAVVILASPADARCLMSYCQNDAAATLPAPGERRTITNPSRQRRGDVYNPGGNRRIQIRNSHRQIIGYIEADGQITNRSRQKVGTVEPSD